MATTIYRRRTLTQLLLVSVCLSSDWQNLIWHLEYRKTINNSSSSQNQKVYFIIKPTKETLYQKKFLLVKFEWDLTVNIVCGRRCELWIMSVTMRDTASAAALLINVTLPLLRGWEYLLILTPSDTWVWHFPLNFPHWITPSLRPDHTSAILTSWFVFLINDLHDQVWHELDTWRVKSVASQQFAQEAAEMKYWGWQRRH